MTILLVRHGETEWNRARRYQGWSDSPLTPHGVAQAEAIGRALAALPEAANAEIVASPLGRARRTAEIIAQQMRSMAPGRFDDRLREISLGSWDGINRVEIEQRMGTDFEEFEWYFRAPDGESYEVFAARVGAWLAEQGETPVVAVCHGITTRVLRGLYAGLPRFEALRLHVPQDRIFRLTAGRIAEIPVDA